MPYRKRTTRRRKTYRRRPMYKPRRKWSARTRKPNVYYFKRFVEKTAISITAGSSNTFGVYSFRLDELPNFAEFTNLYDAYKINRVKISFIPFSNVSLVRDGNPDDFKNTEYTNRLFTVLDYTDVTVPVTINQLREYQSCKWSPNNRIHKRYFKPKVTGIVTAGSFQTSPWLQCSDSSDVQYLGIRYGLTHQATATSNTVYRVEATYYCSFKQVR